MSARAWIALVFDESMSYSRGIMRGIKRFAEERPEWILLPVTATPAAVYRLHQFKIHGIIARVYNRRLFEALRPWHRRLVNVSRVLPDLSLASVAPDNLAVGRCAAEHLLERGFANFGYVGNQEHAYSNDREAGFRQAVEAAGHHVAVYHDSSNLRVDPMSRLWALGPRMQRWAARLPKPAAVFAADDIWGMQITEVVRQAGIRIPEELALVGVGDDDLLCEMARPPLSSVALPTERVGLEAAKLLDQLIAGGRPQLPPTLLPPLGVSTRQSSDVMAVHDRDVAAAVAFIRANVQRSIRVEEVVDAGTTGRRTLERKFHVTLGRGLAAQIRHEQVQRAKRLLLHTDLPMARVAEQSGFSDPYRFSTVFRKLTGVPPSTFRRSF